MWSVVVACLACSASLAALPPVAGIPALGRPKGTAAVDAVLPCKRNGTAGELNQCIATSIDHFLKAAKHGLPEIGLESIDPFVVKQLSFDQGSGKVAVSLDFREVHINGLSDSEVFAVRMNVNDKKMEVSLRAPVYQIEGFYTCNGGVYELPLSSSGRFTITLTDVTAAWMLYFVTSTANNQTAVALNRFLLDMSPANVVFQFDKQFDGENSLGDAMDEFMNENALEIYNDVKPKLMRMFGELFLERANRVLMNYPTALDLS